MTEDWLGTLRARVDQASARHVAVFARLAAERAKLETELARRLTQLGTLAERRERPEEPQLHHRVVAALKAQQFEALSVRDQRYAAKLFDEVSPAQMQALLAARPGNWKTFVTECFLRWDQFDQLPDRAAYARLVCLAPTTVAVLHRDIRPQDLVDRDGPTRLGRSIQARDIVELRALLARRGFDPRWMYTAVAIARWFAERHGRNVFAGAWQAVRSDLSLETLLLPRLVDTRSSWFSSEPRPARVRQSEVAHATFVAALIRAAYDGGVDDAQWSTFTEKLLRSAFGDPRIPPTSRGWQQVQQIDRAAYDRLLQLLISEDIAVFFEHAMKDPRRHQFWLSYLPSLRRTTCIVDAKLKSQLQARLAGSDPRFLAALSRARTYTRTAAVAAFCLYFDAIVVVEFAETGNAAQIYERGYFERQFERSVQANAVRDHAELKTSPTRASQPGIGPRILHMAHWEAEAESTLAHYRLARASNPAEIQERLRRLSSRK